MPMTCVQPLVVKCTKSRLDAMSSSRMTAIARSISGIPVVNSPSGREGGSAAGDSAVSVTQGVMISSGSGSAVAANSGVGVATFWMV